MPLAWRIVATWSTLTDSLDIVDSSAFLVSNRSEKLEMAVVGEEECYSSAPIYAPIATAISSARVSTSV